MENISVLIPTWNRSEFLKQALESIANQTYKGWKVIIYDDGSTDETPKVVAEFSEKYPETKYVWSQTNHGVAFARNMLMELANSPYCIWQDSDDISHPYRLEYMLNAIAEQQADMVFSQMYFYLDGKEPSLKNKINEIEISKYTSREGLYNNMNFATGIFRRELADTPFKIDLVRREDVDWISRLIRQGTKFGYLQKPLYWCRRHIGRLTTTK